MFDPQLFADTGLSANAKVVFMYVCGMPSATSQEIADGCALSRATVTRCLKSLRNAGYIESRRLISRATKAQAEPVASRTHAVPVPVPVQGAESPPVSPPKEPSKRKTLPPENLEASESNVVLARELGLSVTTEVDRFVSYCHANDRRYARHQAALRQWLLNQKRFNDERGARLPSSKAKVTTTPSGMRILR